MEESPFLDPWASKVGAQEQYLTRKAVFPIDVVVHENDFSFFPEPGYPWMGKPHLVVMHYHMDTTSIQGDPYWMFMVHGFNYSTGKDFWMAYNGVRQDGDSRWASVYDFQPVSQYFREDWERVLQAAKLSNQ
jgi:hypothetical protein